MVRAGIYLNFFVVFLSIKKPYFDLINNRLLGSYIKKNYKIPIFFFFNFLKALFTTNYTYCLEIISRYEKLCVFFLLIFIIIILILTVIIFISHSLKFKIRFVLYLVKEKRNN